MRTLVSSIACWGLFACSATGSGPNGTGDGVVSSAGTAGATFAVAGMSGGSGILGTSGGSTSAGGSPATSGAGGTTVIPGTGGAVSGAPGGGGSAPLGSSGSAGIPNTGGASFAVAGNGGVSEAGAPPVTGGASSAGGAGEGGASGAAPFVNIADNLKDQYAAYFPIGAAVDSGSSASHDALLKKHFNSITCENEMKFESVEPTEGNFTYTAADRLVDYAVSNNMKIRGHAFVWHTQNPSWLFSNGSGGTVSSQVLLQRMKNHIDNVAAHFRGKVYAWDVVNEAFMNDGSYRSGDEPDGQQSRWHEIIGDSYIAEAFRYAHDADPDAKLFYNDFYNYLPTKRQAIYEMLEQLLADGVPVHGVGLQAHLNIEPSTDPMNQAYYQHVAEMETAIEMYSSLGLDVQVTEMDVSLYIPGMMYTQDTFYTAAKFTDAIKTQQAERYRAFFELFRAHADVITGVTLWGIADDNTWLSEFDSGREDFPLLFDHDHQPKLAYDAVMGL